MKVCSKCKAEKPVAEFGRSSQTRDGLRPWCKPCVNAANAKYLNSDKGKEAAKRARQKWQASEDGKTSAERTRRRIRHGMTVEDYERRLAAQGGVCAICKEEDPKRTLSVDHDHACCPGRVSCGKCVRGLLCTRCNQGLGYFRDRPSVLLAAEKYLGVYRSSFPVPSGNGQAHPQL